MRWYTAKCLFRSDISGQETHRSKQLCERRFLLVRAENDQEANVKVEVLARKRQHGYRNSQGEEVKWVFEAVLAVKELVAPKLVEGIEIYHEYFYRRDKGVVRARM